MKVNRLSVIDYRNIDYIEIVPSENVNVIFGENAQGKTNLLESIWLFLRAVKSFRSKRDNELFRLRQGFLQRMRLIFLQREESKPPQ